jgi:cardiolipin synthase A/B
MNCLKRIAMKVGITSLAIVPFFLTGCLSPLGAQTADTQSFPAPVTENDMTLAWGPDIKAQALSMIRGSARECDLDMYELSDPDVLTALADAHQRGVDVQVVVDATEKHSQDQALPALKHSGVPVESLRIHSGISHIKMLIVDGSHAGVLIGGMNFGAKSWNNNDASVYLAHPNASYLAVFHWDWQRAGGNPAASPRVQSPFLNERSVEQQVVQAIQQAKSSVDMEAFNLSDWGVLDALKAACRRGVQVEILLDPMQSQNRKNAESLRAAGATVMFYQPYQSEWMHAKIVDTDDGKVFMIGSANFSHQAYTYNHEGDIELTNCPGFHQAFMKNLTLQIGRGADSPSRKTSSTEGD